MKILFLFAKIKKRICGTNAGDGENILCLEILQQQSDSFMPK